MDMEWARAVPVRAPWPTKDETIAELIARLRDVTGEKLLYTNTPNHLRLSAADRIEALKSELAELREELLDLNRQSISKQAELQRKLTAEHVKVAQLEEAGDFARLIGNDDSKDDKDTVLVSYGMLRRLRAALTDGGKDG